MLDLIKIRKVTFFDGYKQDDKTQVLSWNPGFEKKTKIKKCALWHVAEKVCF